MWLPPWLIALAAVGFALYASNQPTAINGLCHYVHSSDGTDDARAAFDTSSLANVSECAFSESYFEARAKFRRLATKAGLELHALPVVESPTARYTIDVAVLRGTGAGLVVHSSGVHGVEGYAGSAVQVAMLEHLAARVRAQGRGPPALVPTLVLVHAVNPYGMAHFRRQNERNVDLNRNALHEDLGEWAAARARDPNVAGYDDFSGALFNPPRAPTAFDAYARVWWQSAYHVLRFGFNHMKRAMVAAQYHRPAGIFYGGTELERSHVLLRDFVTQRLGHDFGPGADSERVGTVTWIDVHTGLGPPGVDTLLTKLSAGVDSNAEARKWFGNGAQVQDTGSPTSAGEGDVGAGYELTIGFAGAFYPRFFHADARTLFVTQEFGTVPGVLVARAMILENGAFNHAPAQQPAWSAFTRDAFYVRTTAWRRSVLERGLALLHQAIARSASSATANGAAAVEA